MGSSPDATLVFGVDLGDGEGFGTVGPCVRHALDVDWYKEWADRDDDHEDYERNYSEILTRTLALRSGWDPDGDTTDDTHIEKRLGVKLIGYGDCQWSSIPYVLTAADAGLRIGTYSAGPLAVRPAELAPAGLHEGAAKIHHALAMLGLTTERQPCWLLVADYG